MAAVLRTHQREKDMVVGRGRRRTRRVVLDLGAHVGYFSLLAAAHGCTVTAVEPNPLHAGLLRLAAATNNAKAGDAVTVVETLVGNTTAPQRFNGFQVISEDASGPVSPPDATSTNSSSSTTTTTSTSQSISTVSLEQLIKRATATTILSEVGSEGEVLFMKVDMEGQEAAVLRSASPAELARVGHIYLELTTHDNGGSGHMGASGHRFLPAAQDAPELLRAQNTGRAAQSDELRELLLHGGVYGSLLQLFSDLDASGLSKVRLPDFHAHLTARLGFRVSDEE